MGHARTTSTVYAQDVEQDATPSRRRSASVTQHVASFSPESGSDGVPSFILPRRRPSKAPSRSFRPPMSALPSSRTSRWLAFGISCILLGFFYSLVHLSHQSAREVLQFHSADESMQLRIHYRYSWLFRYFGGVKRLVPSAFNIPEFPHDLNDQAGWLVDEFQKPEISLNEVLNKPRKPLEGAPGAAIPLQRYNPFTSSPRPDNQVECYLDEGDRIGIPDLYAYEGVPEGYPDPGFGSYKALGLRDDVCFDRYGRYGPYGWGYKSAEGGTGMGVQSLQNGTDAIWKAGYIDWRKVRWRSAQDRCFEKNKQRFAVRNQPPMSSKTLFATEPRLDGTNTDGKAVPRHAVLLRTWHSRKWTQEDIVYVRAMITELSLTTGGQYTVHFLIHVQNDDLLVWSDPDKYDEVMKHSLPEEFQGMGTLFSERQMFLIYGAMGPDVSERAYNAVYRGLLLAFQWWAHNHQEFDYYWHMEMDVRYLGHFYHFFDTVGAWAKEQPRKDLWERNSRFYFPALHGTYQNFTKHVRQQVETSAERSEMLSRMGRGDAEHQEPIWGPVKFPGSETLNLTDSPIPLHLFEQDRYEWGVNEEADFIGFDPMFDPEGTKWGWRDDVVGYNPDLPRPPRRTMIVTNARYSKKLINTMYDESIRHRHTMFTEMWPASCALHHGYKAVYAPHPVYLDKSWNLNLFESLINSGKDGSSGAGPKSPFGYGEHMFLGTTFYYNSAFAQRLWKGWLGFKVAGWGGEEEEMSPTSEGRMCMRPMWIHPIKHVGENIQDVASDGR